MENNNIENNNMESNIKPEPNNSTNSNDSGMLTNILAYNKDNLFTKVIFYLSTLIVLMMTYLGITAFFFYRNAEKSSDLGGTFDSMGQFFKILETGNNLQTIFKWSIIIIAILLILLYLKSKRESRIQEWKAPYFISAIGLVIFGLFEINQISAIIKVSQGNLFSALGINENFVKASLIGSFIFAGLSAFNNYKYAFNKDKIDVDALKTGISKMSSNISDKDKKKYKKFGLLAVGAFAAYYILTNFVLLTNVDLADYYNVTVTGNSGEAVAKVENKSTNTDSDVKINEFLESSNLEYNISKTDAITNNDNIDVTVNYDKEVAKRLKIRVKNSKFSFKVNGLPSIVKNITEFKELDKELQKANDLLSAQQLQSLTTYEDVKQEDFGTYYKQDEKGNLLIRVYKKVSFDALPGPSGKWPAARINYYELSNITVDEKGNFISKGSDYGSYSGFAMNAVDMTVQDLYAKLGLENFQKLK